MDQDLLEEFDLAEILRTPPVFGNYSLNVEGLELLPDLVEAVESYSLLLWADMRMFCNEDATSTCEEMGDRSCDVVVSSDYAQSRIQTGDRTFCVEGIGTSADGCPLSSGDYCHINNPAIFHDQSMLQPSIAGAFDCNGEDAFNRNLVPCRDITPVVFKEGEEIEEPKDLPNALHDSNHFRLEHYDVREVEKTGHMSNVVGVPVQTSGDQLCDSETRSCVDESDHVNTMCMSDISGVYDTELLEDPVLGKQSVLVETAMEELGELQVDWKVEKERVALRILGKKGARTSELETKLDMEVTKFEELWCSRVSSPASHENIIDQFRKTVTSLLNRYCQQQNKRICYLPLFGVEKLMRWVNSDQHYERPYPTQTEIKKLAEDIGLNPKQVEQWFENYRIRTWKHGTRELKKGRFFRYPPEKTSILRDWLKTNNRTNPTPRGDALASLVAATGMNEKQVKQWCYNYRRRHKAELEQIDQMDIALDESVA